MKSLQTKDIWTNRIMATSEKEFFEAVKGSLQEKGLLDKLSGEIRSEVLQILKSDDSTTATADPSVVFKTSSQNFILNELIKEYLEWNGLKHTKDVLVSEAGHPKESLTRCQLEEALNVQVGSNAQKVPLLYSIVSSLTDKN